MIFGPPLDRIQYSETHVFEEKRLLACPVLFCQFKIGTLRHMESHAMAPILHVIIAVTYLTIVTVKILAEALSASVRSPLGNLPGPPSPSWLKGA